MKNFQLILLTILFCLAATLNAQRMSKSDNLNYIERLYQRTNAFYYNSSEYQSYPVGIDSITLEFDQLVIYYNIPGDRHFFSGPRSATISGELTLDEEDNGIKNADGDWVLRTQPGNTAELKKLFYALQNLQEHIETDPFADQVSQYVQQKKQQEAEKRRQLEENQRRREQEQARMARENEERRWHEQQQRQNAEQQRRYNEERRDQEAIRAAQDMSKQSMYGTGNRQWIPN